MLPKFFVASRGLLLCLMGMSVPIAARSQTQSFVREYTHRASDADSKISSRAIALDQVKRLLLEEVATYVQSTFLSGKREVSVDGRSVSLEVLQAQNLKTIAAGLTETKVLEERWDGKEYWLRAEIRLDPEETRRRLARLAEQTTPATGGGGGAVAPSLLAAGIATKDIGSVRVILKSARPVRYKDQGGRDVNGLSCSFEFMNRETQRPIVLAMNAEPFPGSRSGDFPIVHPGTMLGTVLRATLVDDQGNVWRLATKDIVGMGVVSAGGASYSEVPNPLDIVSLLQSGKHQSGRYIMPEGGVNYVGDSRAPYRGAQTPKFYFGATTTIPPGESVAVNMRFVQDAEAGSPGPRPAFFQMNAEIVLGVVGERAKIAYSLQNLALDRVSVRPDSGQ